ncbi:MAG: hypothetical protein CBE47_01060 [Pelagibacteraceae bacterium TMED287]|nr:MAG: hypothetical protein CBE47_01060 [Pelagibacteraceae bacterium TMED287]|tara:strand:+ start:304 stop:642 length:339 start_codon:yes stop_codon:yes gene_type:complete
MATLSNIFIDQDATFTTTVTVNDSTGSALNLTGYTAVAQIRKTYLSSSATSMTVAFATDRSTGQITLSLTATQTGALKAGRYVYDLAITTSDSATTTRVIEGVATVNPSVSR